MKKFDQYFELLAYMHKDDYYPKFLVDRIQVLIEKVIALLETGETDLNKIQNVLDQMTLGINDLAEEFYEHESEIETMARDDIAETIIYILNWFEIDIDIEEAVREREW